MQITITVPELACTRCAVTAPIQPRLVYRRGAVPSQLRGVFTDVLKERVTATAVDDAECEWGVLTDSRPTGWIEGPQASDLCDKCAALWLESGKEFLVLPPPPPPVVEEPPVVVVEQQFDEDGNVIEQVPATMPAPVVMAASSPRKDHNRNPRRAR